MPADLDRVKELFLAAAGLPAADRAAFLAERCGGDAELLAAVERLLAAHDAPDGRVALSGGGPAATNTFAPTDPDADPGRTATHHPSDAAGLVLAGRYRLVEPIGEGGMGTVWMAQQVEPVKRAVAVKLIKAGMDSRAVVARFEAERQALALMDHPNIARVLDAGLTADGRPFFAMELVKGVPITQFCDARRLTPRDRLELFVPVCQAVQHAHQKGGIHRDIKPSNVLVALYDDRPVPKMIDFGVAKAAGTPLTDRTLLTGFGAVVGTPEYMSPEQASFNQLDVDTRSDVYSLGVLLYELLTGSPPHPRKELEKAGLLEILRVVREQEPPRPSVRLSTSRALASIAAVRGTEPARLARLVRGELDWLVMKALEKDRARRYDTANALAAEVQRFLAGEPVQAVPASAAYRLRKFVRMNRGPVAAAGLVLLALMAGVAGTVSGLVQARRAASSERAAKIEAEAEARAARRAEGDARAAETKAAAEAEGARKAEAEAKWQERLAQDARHAIQMDLALRARSDQDYVRMATLIEEMRPEYQGVWETRYVRTLLRRESPLRATFTGHTDAVRSVTFNPDGTRIVSAGQDGTARVWNALTGQEIASLKGHSGWIHRAAFSPDGTRVVTASGDWSARVWDAATGQQMAVLKGHRQVWDAAFSPDGTRVVTASFDKTARVWDAATGQQIADLKGHTKGVTSVAFSPDGTRVVTASEDRTARIWDATTGQEQVLLQGVGASAKGAAFSPDGTRVVTANWDNTARVWDAATGRQKAALKGHTGFGVVEMAAFSSDGTALDQTAVYVLLVREAVAALGGNPEALVSDRVLLVTPRNVGLTPTLSEPRVTARVARVRRVLAAVPDAADVAAATPADVSFGPVADDTADEQRRLDALHAVADRVGTAYTPGCLAACGNARFCRGRAAAAGAPCVAGPAAARLLPGVTSLGRAESLSRGAAPTPAEAPAAALLERAGRLIDEATAPAPGPARKTA